MMTFYSKLTRIRTFGILVVLLVLFSAIPAARSQVVNETTKKKVSIGFGMFTDIWGKMPTGIHTRTINQGVNVFGLYNVRFGKSPVGASIGLGVDVHNCYGNFLVDKNVIDNSTKLVKIPDSVGYKRSKMTMVYLEVPVEINLKTKVHVNLALGFKAGMLIGSHSKYVGDGRIKTATYQYYTLEQIHIKSSPVENLNQFTYGPYFRLGYKWINFDTYLMLSSIFKNNGGPQMSPISIGFVLMPF